MKKCVVVVDGSKWGEEEGYSGSGRREGGGGCGSERP